VLFFEPHEASAEALGAHLQRLGCRATRCHSVQALGEWMQTRPRSAGRPWLLLALDAPESSAVLEQALRGQEPQCILGMTSSESLSADASRHRHELAGVLRKPLMSSALLSSFEARQAEVSTLPTGPRLPRQAGLDLQEGPLVLVVEDDPTNQMIVCAMLHNAGYHTQVAHNGEQALSLLAQQLFDVVLMDWQMPDLDGLEVTRRLRAGVSGGAAARVPIVALTANAFSEDRSACLAAGMNDFLSKPVLRSSLLATLERWTTPRSSDALAHSDALTPSP
jgi:CheY-like chemotaxis protein